MGILKAIFFSTKLSWIPNGLFGKEMNLGIKKRKEIYKQHILLQIPRLLSLLDRSAFSPTSGCFDRTYWQWKFVDFPGARFQEGTYPLALLYTNNFEGNNYFHNAKIKSWILEGINFWTNIQNRDGSFNEAYPNEHSFVATGFSSLYLSETYLVLKDEVPEDISKKLIETFKKAGNWLLKNGEKHAFISNHRAGALLALYNIFKITGEEYYHRGAIELLQTMKEEQSDEGWLNEYNGPDPGYQTQAIYYLALYYQRSRNSQALAILNKSLEFLQYFIHPNGTLGGEYGSRNTEFYFPGGFEILARENRIAKAIANKMITSIGRGEIAGLNTMDSYNFIPVLSTYLTAFLECDEEKGDYRLPCEKSFEKYFDESKLYVVKNNHYYSVLGLSKGGTIRIYNKSNQLVYNNCGYLGKLASGEIITNQWLDYERDIKRDNHNFEINGKFYIMPQKTFSTPLFICFRLLNITLGRNQNMSDWIKKALVKKLISDAKEIPLNFTRTIKYSDDCVEIKDNLFLNRKIELIDLHLAGKFSSIHMGSSRYFQHQELQSEILEKAVDLELLNKQRKIIMQMRIKNF